MPETREQLPAGDAENEAPVRRVGRLSMRFLTGDPAGSVLTILTLALGIGVVTTIFACLDSYLFRGLPFANADRMFHAAPVDRSEGRAEFLMPLRDFARYRQAVGPDIAAMLAYDERTVSLRAGDRLPRRCVSYIIAGSFEEFLGVRPILGPGFAPDDDAPGGRPVLLISHRLWQEEFGGASDVIGRAVLIDGAPWTVVGVMGEEFRFIRNNDLWFPQQQNSAIWGDGGKQPVAACVRVRPGAGMGRVAAELDAIAMNLAHDFPDTNRDYRSVSLQPLHLAALGETTVRRLWTLQAFAVLVLVIGCCNASSLLALRFAARRGEMAVRTALGATRLQLVAQIVGECSVFAVAGSLCGIAIATVGTDLLWKHLSVFAPYWVAPFEVSPSTITFVVLATLVAGLLASIGPAVHGSSVAPAEVLKDDQRTGVGIFLRRFTTTMVVVQVAVAFALLTAGGLMVRAIRSMEDVPLPFDPGGVVTARVTLRGDDADPAFIQAFYDRLERELEESHPELGPVAFSSREGMNRVSRVAIESDGNQQPVDTGAAPIEVAREVVSPGYFSVLGVAPLQGREFSRLDTGDTMPVAIVNQAFARLLWPDEDAIGRRFRTRDEDEWLTVVGVVPNLRQQGLLDFFGRAAGFYRPLAQAPDGQLSILARPRGAVSNWGDLVRRAISSVDADQAPKDVGTMLNSLEGNLAIPRALAFLLAVFGTAATILAAAGLYGLMAFSVAMRTREFGIRMVFGAVGRDIAKLATRQGVLQMAPGLIAGAAFSLLASRLLQRAELLGGIGPLDPWVYGTVVAVIAIVTAVAIARPVRRAMRLEPWEAVRHS